MATSKITITIPDAQLREIRALVDKGKTASVSGFVTHAVKIALEDVAGWRQMIAQALEETGGPPTKEEQAWADSILSPRRKAPRKRRAA